MRTALCFALLLVVIASLARSQSSHTGDQSNRNQTSPVQRSIQPHVKPEMLPRDRYTIIDARNEEDIPPKRGLQVIAKCPNGMQILGGGFDTTLAGNRLQVIQSQPIGGAFWSWSVFCTNTSSEPVGPTGCKAIAICGRIQ